MVNERVCVLWYSPTGVRTLTYRPEGTVRTYMRDAVDPRGGPYVYSETLKEAIESLAKGQTCVVPLSVAMELSDGSWKFA